eukprot:PhF_6_TR19030/c0_g1_i2/m.27940/K00868/pdxK, pdxY; pyridoxine kinase
MAARILSIQSHVVHGYVGNRAAVLPLQSLGFDVDVINTVVFSNHTAYPTVKGAKMTASEFNTLWEGLDSNGFLDSYDYVLTGYLGLPETIDAIIHRITELKARNPNVKYMCDPVCGDEGKLYVSHECIPKLQQLLKCADIARLNEYELQVLTGVTISDRESFLRAVNMVHNDYRVPIVITSNLSYEKKNEVRIVISEQGQQHVVVTPRIDEYFTGAGDLMSALVLGHSHLEDSVRIGTQIAVGALYQVCLDTAQVYEKAKDNSSAMPSGKTSIGAGTAQLWAAKELRIVQNMKHLSEPP